MLFSPCRICAQNRPDLASFAPASGSRCMLSQAHVHIRIGAARRPSYLDDEVGLGLFDSFTSVRWVLTEMLVAQEEIPEREDEADLTGLLELDPTAGARCLPCLLSRFSQSPLLARAIQPHIAPAQAQGHRRCRCKGGKGQGGAPERQAVSLPHAACAQADLANMVRSFSRKWRSSEQTLPGLLAAPG